MDWEKVIGEMTEDETVELIKRLFRELPDDSQSELILELEDICEE